MWNWDSRRQSFHAAALGSPVAASTDTGSRRAIDSTATNTVSHNNWRVRFAYQSKAPTSRQSKPAHVGAAVETTRTGTYEELSGTSTRKTSVSVPQSGREGVEMTDLGHKRRQGSDATDKRPLRETF